MCGRFTRYHTWADICRLCGLTSEPSNLQPHYNVCPTDAIDVVVRGDDQWSLVPMRWGLIPGWWQKPLKGNAACDVQRDNAIPEGKQPYYFTLRDGPVMTFAGIQDAWTDRQTGERLRSCAMVITE